MKRFKNKISFVIATKDRPDELRTVLDCLNVQTTRPDEVVVVDGGALSISEKSLGAFGFRTKYLRFQPPSAARQRNAGIEAIDEESNLIGFLDDDIVLEKNAMERMLAFWDNASNAFVGAAFNMINHPPLAAPAYKHSALAVTLGLYSKDPGKVLRSGFQTMIGTLDKTRAVDWIPTGAAVWRRFVFDSNRFDDWYSASSYLEDLEFSYRLAKAHRLVVVAEARYYHFPARGGREHSYAFGKREVANRIYFVKKNAELSLATCLLALSLRMLLTLFLFLKSGDGRNLKRIIGNVVGFKQAFLGPR